MLPIILVSICLVSVIALVPLAIRAHRAEGLRSAVEKIDFPSID